MTDRALLRRARCGEHEAYAAVFERHASLVHGILLARAPLSDVDDAMQEVFLASWRRLGTLQDDDALGPWLATIARRTAVSFLRWRWKRLTRLKELLRPPREPDDRTVVHEILEEIRRLPEPYQEPLILRLVEQMPGEQIAARTGLTPGSVRVNLHRGMKLLRERLEDHR